MSHGIPVLGELLMLAGVSLAVVMLFRRLRLPAAIGFIVSGVLIGPGGFALIPDQDPVEIFRNFEAYVRRIAPSGVTVRVLDLHSAPPFLTEPDHPALEAARRALKRAWSKPPVMIREGGSIPVMATFQETHAGVPSILIGFGLDDDQVHSPNEKFSLTSFHGGTKSVAYLYQELAKAR